MENKLEQALKEAQSWMHEIEGVASVGQGKINGEDCIAVYVEKSPESQEIKKKIPSKCNGIPVDIRETDPISIQPQ
ncbi:hypothetical protein MYX75_02300 [Acidobacteria bacterium AH-259-A15]|nr:hypothetical protein [Acidobacteria bacterium AH-259-A15]